MVYWKISMGDRPHKEARQFDKQLCFSNLLIGSSDMYKKRDHLRKFKQ